MTEKRFYVAESKLIDGYCVFDREKKYFFSPRPRMADCLNDAHTLNELVEENQSLKIDNKELIRFITSKGYTLQDYIKFIGQFQSVGVNKEDWE